MKTYNFLKKLLSQTCTLNTPIGYGRVWVT